MGDETRGLVVQDPDETRKKALALVAKYESRGAIAYVRPEDMDTQGMFVPVPTLIEATPDDFHQISGGGLQPKGPHTEKIAHATGVSIYNVSTRKEGEYTWVGSAKGRRRMPDGTYEEKGAEYEFNAELRAEEDFLKEPGKYANDVKKRQHVLALCRFARARAETGASYRVIRKLAQIPTAFKRNEIDKVMVFARIEINSNLLFSNPATAHAAVQHAMGDGGAVEQLYGAQGQDAEPVAALPAPDPETITGVAETMDAVPFCDTADETDETPEEIYTERLRQYLADSAGLYHISDAAKEAIAAQLVIEKPALEALKALDKKIGDYLRDNGRKPMPPVKEAGGAS